MEMQLRRNRSDQRPVLQREMVSYRIALNRASRGVFAFRIPLNHAFVETSSAKFFLCRCAASSLFEFSRG